MGARWRSVSAALNPLRIHGHTDGKDGKDGRKAGTDCAVERGITRRKEAIMAHTNNVDHQHMRPDLAHDDVHDLMPDWLAETVPAPNTTEYARDPLIHVKLFTPDAGWRWYVTEYDAEQRLAVAFVPGAEGEWDEISLDDLAAIRGPMGLGVERDLFWRPTLLSLVQRGAVR
jgi:Protein of unknown function (DUF2958)